MTLVLNALGDGWNYNAYYNPEKFGCEVVMDIDVGQEYEFDMFAVLRTIEPIEGIHKGTYFYASDTGCSCPVPFDDAYWTKATKAELTRAFDNWAGSRYSYRDSSAEIQAGRNKIWNL
jgi:hypothetical protein